MGNVDIRRLWDDVTARIRKLRIATWALISHNAQVVDFRDNVLTLGFASAGLRDQYANGGHEAILKQALTDVIGVQPKVEAIVAGSGAPPRQAAPPPVPDPQPVQQPEATQNDWAQQSPPPDWAAEPPPDDAPPPQAQAQTADGGAIAKARQAIQPTRTADFTPPPDESAARLAEADAAADPNDQAYDGPAALGAQDLLSRELGATMIEEIPNNR